MAKKVKMTAMEANAFDYGALNCHCVGGSDCIASRLMEAFIAGFKYRTKRRKKRKKNAV